MIEDAARLVIIGLGRSFGCDTMGSRKARYGIGEDMNDADW
ncbi:MAG: hypothetical protein BWY17_03879 [Deltaproteobacteria bacterium ADurb.Bin207]|jgi:hypothetical protein|nr:MAG: hypothetical protein BWY17_03879 [Deltaproteobacteria bacterium ADurb.Bin207]